MCVCVCVCVCIHIRLSSSPPPPPFLFDSFHSGTAGEMLAVAEPYLQQNMHPTILVSAYNSAMEEALAVCEKLAFPIDIADEEQLLSIVRSCIGTKFVSRYGDMMCKLALKAVLAVATDLEDGKKEIDIKRYC